MPHSLDRLCLIDGSGYIFRAFFGCPKMTRADGTPVNAVYGFCTMITKLLRETEANFFGVIFDRARYSFRNDIYEQYKAHRDEVPEDLVPQFPLIRQACRAYNIPAFDMENFEADDLIATYAKRATSMGMKVDIVSNDKDLMQLVDDDISLFDPVKNISMGREQVKEKFGVYPDNVIDVQSLAGDRVDNIPGVPGIGIKIAAQLINEYGDLDSLLARAMEIQQPKRRENLLKFADQARISRRLVTLKNDVEVLHDIDFFKRRKIEEERVRDFLLENNFKRLLAVLDEGEEGENTAVANGGFSPNADDMHMWQAKDLAKANAGGKYGQNSGQQGGGTLKDVENTDRETVRNTGNDTLLPTDIVPRYLCIDDIETLKQWLEPVKSKGILAIDTETTSLHIIDAELVGISLCHTYGMACYIPLNYQGQQATTSLDLFTEVQGDSGREDGGQNINPIALPDVVEVLKPILQDASILKVGQNIKYDLSILHKVGLQVNAFDDTMLLSFCCDAGRHGHSMDELAKRYLNYHCTKFEDICGKGKNAISFKEVDIELATQYACEDADITLRLHTLLKDRAVRKKVMGIYQGVERPLIETIAEMERCGVMVDHQKLQQLSKEFDKKIFDVHQSILPFAKDFMDSDFNVASPKQLGELLFTHLGLKGGKKTKSGAYSTSADVLENLKGQHSIIEDILTYRLYCKLKSTYTDALQVQRNSRTKRVHTSYNMVGAQTGRLSSTEPNLQNIPVRGVEGRKLRSCFVVDKDNLLVSLDYSQIELRIVAHMSDDHAMIQAFKEGVDIHTRTASSVFSVPEQAVDKDLRNRAKAINFGILYGVSAHGLAKQIGCGRSEAKQFMDTYFAKFPGIVAFMEDVKSFAQDRLYVKTAFGRKIHLSGIESPNPTVRAHAQRQAINAPIQGTAADIIKRAMVQIHKIIVGNPDIKMVLQVHDELLFDVRKDKAENFMARAKTIMQNAHTPLLSMKVPLLVEGGMGQNWSEAH